MGRTWTFRGDQQLDPILKEWTDRSEKSFHVRQALRQYLLGTVAMNFQIQEYSLPPELTEQEINLSFEEWK